ncbi:MAG: hypothetical protein JW384_02010 [Nitrosomonadaceae bacterium]|nr:hypothetical protein [Nitrosomonadaceae bacterium]
MISSARAFAKEEPFSSDKGAFPHLQIRLHGYWLCALVLHIHLKMILEICAHTGKVMHRFDSHTLEVLHITNSRELQNLWSINRSPTKNDFFTLNYFALLAAYYFNTHRSLTLKKYSGDL